MSAQRKRERRELIEHVLAQPWNVFGTLKFINGRTIGRDTAHKLLRSYWNRVDRVYFGKAAERKGVRVPRWCFAHEGSDSENYHVHFAALAPTGDCADCCVVLNALWAQHHRQTAPLTKNWIMPVLDRDAVAEYLTREYWRMGDATLRDELCWSRTSAGTLAQYEHDQQRARIAAAVGSLWRQRAEEQFFALQDKYKDIGDFTAFERC